MEGVVQTWDGGDDGDPADEQTVSIIEREVACGTCGKKIRKESDKRVH